MLLQHRAKLPPRLVPAERLVPQYRKGPVGKLVDELPGGLGRCGLRMGGSNNSHGRDGRHGQRKQGSVTARSHSLLQLKAEFRSAFWSEWTSAVQGKEGVVR